MKKVYDNEEGSIGIGSLIIFIALMVVAAIAAAVIVGTVSSMRDRAYGAASSADHMINGNVWNAQYIGFRYSKTSPSIGVIQISFSVVSNSIDISNTTIEYASNNTGPIYFSLNMTDTTSAFGYKFSANVIAYDNSASGWDPANGKYWASPGELVVITINLTSVSAPIYPTQHATVTIIPDPGAPYEHEIIAPADFGTDKAIEL